MRSVNWHQYGWSLFSDLGCYNVSQGKIRVPANSPAVSFWHRGSGIDPTSVLAPSSALLQLGSLKAEEVALHSQPGLCGQCPTPGPGFLKDSRFSGGSQMYACTVASGQPTSVPLWTAFLPLAIHR